MTTTQNIVINVTRSCIKNGVKNSMDHCAIALAFKTKGLSFRDYEITNDLSDVMLNWMEQFDNGAKVKPVKFKIKK